MLRLAHWLLPPELRVLCRLYKILELADRPKNVNYIDLVDAPPNATDTLIASLNQVVLAKSYIGHLSQKGYVDYDSTMSGENVRTRLTAPGFELARSLDSFWGTVNYFYKQHKDGILGLVITILVSVVTAYITTVLTTR